MWTTLDLDDDVLRAARQLARSNGTSLGRVVSTLARAGLQPTPIEIVNGLPTIRARPGAQVVTSEMVHRPLGDL